MKADSETKDVHAIKYKMSKAKERCMTYFRSLHLHLQVLSNEDLKGTRTEHGFKRVFMSLIGQDVETFTKYTRIEAKDFRDTLLQHMSSVKKLIAKRACYQRQYDRRVNETQMQMQEGEVNRGKALDADLVVTENIKPVNDKEPMAEVQMTAEYHVLANEHQHTRQSEPTYYTYLLEKVNSNTTPDSINTSNKGGEIDQNAKICQVTSHLLNPSPDNMTTEFANQSLKSENISLKKTVAQFQKDFSRIEAHCVNLELKYQNQALKFRQHGQILNETSNKAKIKKEIKILETINIELEHITHYLPKVREHVLAKPHHVIAPGSSRNFQEGSYGLNDMAHNNYLEEARKKTQERNRKSKPSVMHTTSLQNTTNGSTQKPRSNNQTSRSLPGVNSRAKIQSHKTRNSTKPVEPTSHTQKPSRQIVTGHRFSPNKSSAVHEKPNTPRSCLRWKPTGRIFKTAGLRWIPTGKIFTSSTTKVDSEPPNGSNKDITNPYECEQTLNSWKVNRENQVVSKSSAVTAANASNKRQQQLDLTSSTSTLASSVTANGNFDL
ncbi:hypothetical protein Tco_0073319 [Tanacetum coccineum]